MKLRKTYIAPGPGVWELDNSHFSRPMSLFSKEMFTHSLVQGLKEGTSRYGLALSHLSYEMVNGFFYKKAVIYGLSDDHVQDLPKDLFERSDFVNRLEEGERALESRKWRADLKRWDEEVKPDSIKRNKRLQSISLESLGADKLIKHINECRENALEMMYRHHLFTIPAVLPIGLYISKVCAWSGVSSSELLNLLQGSTPGSKGAAENELDALVHYLEAENISPNEFSNIPATEVLKQIKSRSKDIQNALQRYFDFAGYRLVTGYDVTDQYGYDMPEILVNNILNHFKKSDSNNDNHLINEKTEAIRSKVPNKYHAEFDSLLEDARMINRLRDERGIYNDVLGTGLARRAILEAGKRMEEQGCLSDRNLLLHASFNEMVLIIQNKCNELNQTLEERFDWWKNNTVDDAPLTLGGESLPPPPITIFPEKARTAMIALFTAMHEIYDDSKSSTNQKKIISGMPVNAGIYEGIARIICNLQDFNLLKKGDILVTKNTTAAFNAILPLLGGIVTDRGGQLSHAAIVAREYGIPAVVGTKNSTQIIKDGTRIRIDGGKGTVEVML